MSSIVKRIRRCLNHHLMEVGAIFIVASLAFHVFVPRVSSALAHNAVEYPSEEELAAKIKSMQNEVIPHGSLPEARKGKPIQVFTVPVTAYSSEVGQTDSTPFTTASGTHVRRGVVAANFLPIGTLVRFPDLYGDEVFIVEDRMNRRYWRRMDIWMESTAEARQFGVKHTTIEVL